MKQHIMAVCVVMMMLLSIGSVFASEGADPIGTASEFDKYIAQQDGKILAENVYTPSWIQVLFQGQAFSFVDAGSSDLEDYSCDLQRNAGSYQHNPGDDRKTGGLCGIDDAIVFVSDGGDIPAGTILFDNVWIRKESSDLPNFKNYYLDNKNFAYSYGCYECEIQDTSSSEPGCLTDNADQCVAQDHPQCDQWYGYESVCMQHIQDDEPDQQQESTADEDAIDIELAETTKDEYEVGEIVTVVGYADINEDVNDAVIETSLEYVEYVDFQPFAISAVSKVDKGVCGDDITTGVKFDADEGDRIAFKLKMTAKEAGEYRIKVVAATGCGQGITDSYRVDKFSIVAGSEPEDENPDQDGTVDEETPSEDVSEGSVIDWSDFAEEDSDENNDVSKVENAPAAKIAEKYFDYDNEPQTAYAVTAILIMLVGLLAYIIYQARK